MATSASRSDSVRAQVTARLANVRFNKMKNMITRYGIPFTSAPLLSPPISTGMTDCIAKLKAIFLSHDVLARDEYEKVRPCPSLSGLPLS